MRHPVRLDGRDGTRNLVCKLLRNGYRQLLASTLTFIPGAGTAAARTQRDDVAA